MVKISRSAFFSMLVASGAIILAEGCGSGTRKNSSFIGAYQSAYTIPSLNESGSFDFTIDVKGHITGTLNNLNGKIREVTGTLDNGGSFSGSTLIRATSVTGTIGGTMSGLTAGGIGITVPVTGGNFQLVESGVSASGNFVVGATPTAPGSSNFQGFFTGNYNIPGLSQNGTLSFSVDAAGVMTGQLVRGSETGLLTGTIASTGNFTATVKFASDSQTFVGTLVKTQDSSTLGNFTVAKGGKTYAGTFSKTTVTTGDSPFKGSYRGTYGIPEQGENGNLSFTVGPSGSLTGFFSQSNNSPVGTFTGAFNNDGSFAGTITYDPSTKIVTRTITGLIGTGLPSGHLSGDFVMTINGALIPGDFEVAGGSGPDSFYQASYTDGGKFDLAVFFGNSPTTVFHNAQAAEFSVDQEGSILGAFTAFGQDNNGNNIIIATYPLEGRVTNDGRITGTITGEDKNDYAFRGVINKLTWTFADKTSNPGVKADLIYTIKGVEYTGFLKATGGDGISGAKSVKIP